MKYVFLLATVAVVYFFGAHRLPVAPVVAEITQQEAAPLTTGLRSGPASLAPAAPAEQHQLAQAPD